MRRVSISLVLVSCFAVAGCECELDMPGKEASAEQPLAANEPAALPPENDARQITLENGPAALRAAYLTAQGLDVDVDYQFDVDDTDDAEVDYDFDIDDADDAAYQVNPLVLDEPALRTLSEAAKALRTRLSVIAHNLANAETPAFKRRHAELADVGYEHRQLPGVEDSLGQSTPHGISIGGGVRVAAVRTDFSQGRIAATNRPLDVAIEGDGFFQVADPSGVLYFVRAGHFSKNANGEMVFCTGGVGRLLDPPISLPEDVTCVSISPEGIVSVQQAGSVTFTQLGTIQLARFVNPEGLLPAGDNLYAESPASGPATIGNPGTLGLGHLRQNALEESNVRSDAELRDWARTQRLLATLRDAAYIAAE